MTSSAAPPGQRRVRSAVRRTAPQTGAVSSAFEKKPQEHRAADECRDNADRQFEWRHDRARDDVARDEQRRAEERRSGEHQPMIRADDEADEVWNDDADEGHRSG